MRMQIQDLVLSVMLGCLLGCVSTQHQERVKLFNDDGMDQFARGNYREAKDSFRAALELSPNDPSLLFNAAQCYDRAGDTVRAEHYYTACLQRDPAHGDARLALMSVFYRTGRREEANRMIEQWLAKEPGLADVYVLDAWRLRQENALPQAQMRLQQALALEPANRRAMAEMGILYEVLGRPERSYVLYERILARNPNQVEINNRLEFLKTNGVKRPLPD